MRALFFLSVLSIITACELAYASEEKKAVPAPEPAKAGLSFVDQLKDIDEDKFVDLYIKIITKGKPEARKLMAQAFNQRYWAWEVSLPKKWKQLLHVLRDPRTDISDQDIQRNAERILVKAMRIPEKDGGLCGKEGISIIQEFANRESPDSSGKSIALDGATGYFEFQCSDLVELFGFFLGDPHPSDRQKAARKLFPYVKTVKSEVVRKTLYWQALASQDPVVRMRVMDELDSTSLDFEDLIQRGLSDQDNDVVALARRKLLTCGDAEKVYSIINKLTRRLTPEARLKYLRNIYELKSAPELPSFFKLRTLALAVKDKNKENQEWAAGEMMGFHKFPGIFILIRNILLKHPTKRENARLIDLGARAAVCAFADYTVPEGTRNKQINSLLFARNSPRKGYTEILGLLEKVAQAMRQSRYSDRCRLTFFAERDEFDQEFDKLIAQLSTLKKSRSPLSEPEEPPCPASDTKDVLAPLEGKAKCDSERKKD